MEDVQRIHTLVPGFDAAGRLRRRSGVFWKRMLVNKAGLPQTILKSARSLKKLSQKYYLKENIIDL
jgi:hypothetical protein